jgi:4-amino-4-deoxy-L-arabinose transferase-like glycosyltransferase
MSGECRRARTRVQLIAVAIVALAAAMRLWRFDDLPGGLLLDEAFNGVDILDVLAGAHPVFFTRNFGREPFFIYQQVLTVWALGTSPFALRIVGFAWGLLAVPTTYVAVRRLAGTVPALAAAFWIATAPWPVIFSRIGLRTIAIPALVAIAVYALDRAVSAKSQRACATWGAAHGLACAAAIATYPSARLFPIATVLWLGYLLWRRSISLRSVVILLGAAALVGLIAVSPLAAYFLRHPEAFVERANAVSAFNPEQNEGSTFGALWLSTTRTLGAFVISGDPGWDRNVPFQPIFDPLTGLLFLVGVALAVRWFREKPAGALLLVWLVVMAIPNVVTTLNVPNYLRFTGALPAIAALFGLGAAAIRSRTWLLAPLLLWCALAGGYTVFVDWANAPDRYFVFQTDRVAALAVARLESSQNRRVYVAGAAEFDPVVEFIAGMPARRRFGIFDPRVALTLPPPGMPASYVLPRGIPQAPRLARLLPVPRVPIARDPRGEVSVEFAPSQIFALPPVVRPLSASIGDVAELLSYDLPRRAAPGDEIQALVVSRALRSDPRSLVWFGHLVDSSEKVWARRDVFGIPSVGWRQGDVNVVLLQLRIPPDAPRGAYRVASGLYDRDTLGRLPVGDVDRALLGPLWVAPRDEAAPDVATPVRERFGDSISLDGYTLERRTDSVAIDLRWAARDAVAGEYTGFVHVVDAAGKLIAQVDARPPRPTSTWEGGDAVLDRRELPLPPGATALLVGLYDARTQQRLPLERGGDAYRIPLP